jgi:outer membrane lipoprotein-sorting protein
MKIRLVLLAGAAALALAAGSAQAAAPAPASMGADDIIARQIAARGGADKLAAIKSLRFEGKLLAPGDFRLDMVQFKTRVGKTRTDLTIQGLTIVQAWDGAQGWQIQPFSGRKDAEALPPDDVKDLVDDGDIDGPLYDYKARGGKVEYLGTEDVDGTPAYKLRLTEKSGDQLTYFIDTDSLMTIRIRTKRTLRGHEQEAITDFGDYEQVAGVYFPFENESAPPGVNDKQKIVFSKGEANVSLDDAQFRMPGAK